ncbi:MAG TPA: ATP-binding protein [Pyrinomonadaceae bacterium]|jgi:two-component system NtrC family sensor kinase
MTDQTNDAAGESAVSGQTANIDGVNGSTKQPDAATLRTITDTVRRVVRADTASVVSFSIEKGTITWRATSGFHAHIPGDEIVRPLRNIFERCATGAELITLEGIGERADLPVEDFPILSAEGVRYAALAPLCARDGEVLGSLVVGFRSAHRFTAEEKQMLEALADMAALALDNARLFETVGTAKRIWEQTFDAVASGIIVHDQSTRIVRCNAHAAEMMNMQPSEAIGLSCADAFARLFGERAAAYHMGQGTGTASSFEIQAEDGRRYLVSVAPLDKVGNLSGSVITWSDVTELSEMQEQLSRSRRLATVGQLAAGVAHEINNPLAAITTCAEATLRDIKRDGEVAALAESRDWSYYLEEIVRQALRCKEITRGLLDLSRQRRARRSACDINSIAAESARLAEQRAASMDVIVTLNLDESVGEIATDAGMVRQVLDNLLSNALDAVEGRGEVTISTMREGERVAVEVMDTGHGITPEVLVRIFDPFFTTKDPGKGSGLGLAICYTLAEALGGALTVESKQDEGSRFRLWLPRRAPEREG